MHCCKEENVSYKGGGFQRNVHVKIRRCNVTDIPAEITVNATKFEYLLQTIWFIYWENECFTCPQLVNVAKYRITIFRITMIIEMFEITSKVFYNGKEWIGTFYGVESSCLLFQSIFLHQSSYRFQWLCDESLHYQFWGVMFAYGRIQFHKADKPRYNEALTADKDKSIIYMCVCVSVCTTDVHVLLILVNKMHVWQHTSMIKYIFPLSNWYDSDIILVSTDSLH